MNKIILFIFFLLSFLHFQHAQSVKLVQQWKHKQEIHGTIMHSIVDCEGNLFLVVFMQGVFLLNDTECTNSFITHGQGPNEVSNLLAIFNYDKNIAIFEMPEKIKVFNKNGKKCNLKEVKWIKRDPFAFFMKDALYHDNKLFLVGTEFVRQSPKSADVAFIKIYDLKSNRFIKNLINENQKMPNRLYELKPQIIYFNGCVYYLKQNELKLFQISVNTLELTKAIPLNTPSFYKSMPANCYVFQHNSNNEYLRDLENWMTSYSSITKAVITKSGYLIIQIRTGSQKMKKFALLFYNGNDNFSLSNVIQTDDLLLAGKDDQIYCYQNGDPSIDEAGEAVIKVYQIGK
jgi:hypothetical protein